MRSVGLVLFRPHELEADVVCFLDSCFDFSVKSSIICKYAAEVLELGHLLELSAFDIDVKFTGCFGHLHRIGLAVLRIEVFTGGVCHKFWF